MPLRDRRDDEQYIAIILLGIAAFAAYLSGSYSLSTWPTVELVTRIGFGIAAIGLSLFAYKLY